MKSTQTGAKKRVAGKRVPDQEMPLAKDSGQERNSSYWDSIKTTITDSFALPVIVTIGIALGVATQLNWIQLKCEDQPFITLTPDHCRHNLARVIAGGALATLVLLLITSAFRKLNDKISIHQATLPLILLLPMALLPLTTSPATKQMLTIVPVILFLAAAGFVLRNVITSRLVAIFAQPNFKLGIKKTGKATVYHLSGTLLEVERDYIYDCISDLMLDIADAGEEIIIDVTNLKDYRSSFCFIFQLLAGLAVYSQKPLFLRGETELCKAIRQSFVSTIFGSR